MVTRKHCRRDTAGWPRLQSILGSSKKPWPVIENDLKPADPIKSSTPGRREEPGLSLKPTL
jgi:hypothetical protein